MGKINYLSVAELKEKLYLFDHCSTNYGRKQQHEYSSGTFF